MRREVGAPVTSLSASGSVRDGLSKQIGASTEQNEAAREAKNKQHQAVRDKAAARAAAEADKPEEILPAYEDIASLEIEMADGRIMVLERPKAGTMNYKIAMLLGSDVNNALLVNIARSLCHIASIGGQPVSLANKLDFIRVQDDLGETAIDFLAATVNEHFPYFNQNQLKIVKKTLKT